MRSGLPSARAQDLCYADCFTALSPNSPLSIFRAGGSSFTDFYSFSMDPNTGSGSNFWDVVGLRLGSDGSSVDDDTFLAPNRYYNSSLTSSAQSPPRNDYVLVNGNSGHAPDTVYFPQVHSFSSVGGSYSIEWGSGHIVAGTSTADSMAPADVARVYDSFLSTGTKYYFGLHRTSGNTSNYTLALHSASRGSYQGRSSAVADSTGAPGSPLLISYTTGADPSQFDGVVVMNNNGGSGGYTLYRDTAVPSGTVTIDGGAASTANTTLSLALSATNPTAGDPVTDMAISINGKPYGAFKKYTPSTTVHLSSGSSEGVKTVAVEFQNGAGAVSAPATATIYLVTSPPAISSVSPDAGSTSGGTAVTIKGAHFAPGSTVKFGSTVATTVTFVSGSRLNVVAPAHSAGTVRIEVITPAGTSSATNSDLYAYGAPTVTSISPNSGPTGGGTTVTIHGTGFVPDATVTFGAHAASSVIFVSATEVQAVSPAHAAGSVHITVTTAAGTSPTTSADRFTY